MSRSAALFVLASTLSISEAQPPVQPVQPQTEKHGTCATAIVAPFGAAFIIDSRITETDSEGHFVSQHPGCKVVLARPTILLAGVGIEDTTGRAGHWNSLDEASAALKKLPENPTIEQLSQWSNEWSHSLWQHYRQGGETPTKASATIPISEVLLITRVGSEFYVYRSGVEWDGIRFGEVVQAGEADNQHPQVEYSGLCRQFTNHVLESDVEIPAMYRNQWEKQRMDRYGERKKEAKTADDLMYAATGLENVLTDIDARLEPEHPAIAPPYATAEWADGDKGWTTHFNSECGSDTSISSSKGK